MVDLLHLDLTIQTGHEVRAARDLAERLLGPQWRLLAALAAEIVAEHERRALGATTVVVVTHQTAEVLQDLRRAATPETVRQVAERVRSGN